MNDLTKEMHADHPLSPARLEYVLMELAKFGKPRLSMPSGAGWYCVVDMHVGAIGVSFEVKSELGCNTPLGAALQCRERISRTLETLATRTGNEIST